MSFTVINKFQVSWYSFPDVEKQLHCSSQCFSIDGKLEEITKLCERFVTDYWFIYEQYRHKFIVGFIAPKDVVSFKTFFSDFEASDGVPADKWTSWAETNKKNRLKTFSLNFLIRLEGYAKKRDDKTAKFKFDIFNLVDIQAAILEKSKQKTKDQVDCPELDKISTRRLLQYYRKQHDPVFVHTVGEISREVIKQVLNTREHVDGNKPSWHPYGYGWH